MKLPEKKQPGQTMKQQALIKPGTLPEGTGMDEKATQSKDHKKQEPPGQFLRSREIAKQKWPM
jgi:hypothetical protein